MSPPTLNGPIDTAAAVITRLKAEVPALATVGGARAFADLVAKNILPNRMPAAFVIQLGERAGYARRMGAIAHDVVERVAVVIVDRIEGDDAGARGSASLWPVKAAVRTALAGWPPAAGYAAFAWTAAYVVGLGKPGGVAEQIEFETEWKLHTREERP